jgi:molybdenum cofactor cytidylyltransferase
MDLERLADNNYSPRTSSSQGGPDLGERGASAVRSNENVEASRKMISLIVLAAGKSTRMKENKLLLEVDGETLIGRVVKTAKESSANEIVVVLGYEAAKIKEQLAKLDCKLVVNNNYVRGQSESVKVGLAAISNNVEAVMILPADVALIDSQSINRVIEEYRRSRNKIVIASHQQQSGHPILIDKTLFAEVSEIGEDTQGLKAMINHHRAEIKYVEVGTENVLIDIDTKEEFDKYFRRAA